MDNFDLYGGNTIETGSLSQDKVYDLMKAMSAGSQTGRDLDGTDTSGSALKVESLEPTLKVLTNKDKHIVFWKTIPKQKAYNTIEEYIQHKDYGTDIGVSLNEGETPQFTDSIYRRESILIKYMGVAGEVTHPATLVNVGAGVGNLLAKEVQNKTMFLLRAINRKLVVGDSEAVTNDFDGIFKQHYVGVTGGTTVNWDSYFSDSTVIDTRGKALKDENVESAVEAVVSDNFGEVSMIMGAPIVFSNYVKRFHESKRVNVGQTGAVVGATMGQSVNVIQTQNGPINISNDIYFDKARREPKAYNASATSTKAPAVPVASTLATVADSNNTKFSDSDGDYRYAVTAKNRYGESSMVSMDASAISVGVTESVDITFTHTDGAYAVESFVIYRTEKNPTGAIGDAKYYPILTVSKAQWTAGYDGGAAGVVRDRNRFIANTSSAIVCTMDTDVLAYKQLAPMMRMDLARTSPSYRFMVLNYGTPVLYAPKKIARIVNLGSDIS